MQSRDLKLTLEQIPNLRPHRRDRSFVSSRLKATPCLVPRFASGMFSEEPSRRGIRPPTPPGDREPLAEKGPCSQYAPESVPIRTLSPAAFFHSLCNRVPNQAASAALISWSRRDPDSALANQWEESMKANYKMPVAALASIILGALAMMLSVIATALAQDTVRVRGTIERIDGSTYMVKARDGAELKVALADTPQIAGVVKASLSDIKQGSFVGVTAMPRADGSQSALEVHIFPEAMRGTGEKHYPWDLRPQSTMTNANVEQIVTAVDGQTLTLKYKDGEKKIFVATNTPIVVYVPGDKSDLKPGAKVFIAAAIKQPDGTLQARAWRV